MGLRPLFSETDLMSNAPYQQWLMSDLYTSKNNVGERALKTIDQTALLGEPYLAARGVSYFINWVRDDKVPAEGHPSSTEIYAEFVSSPTKYTILHADQIASSSTAFVLKIYRDYTLGAVDQSITIRSTRVGLPNVEFIPPDATFTTYAAATPTGDTVAPTPLFTSGRGSTGGGETGSGFLRILPPNSTFLVELDNRVNSIVYSQYQLRFSEVPAEYLPKIGIEV